MADIERAVELQVARVSDRLVRDYAGKVPDEVVRTIVNETYRAYAPARVTQFLPVLVDRAVRQRLGYARRESA
jgi:hypothetical protein